MTRPAPSPNDVAPESIAHLIPNASPLSDSVRTLPTFSVPWDLLSETNGWVVWLGHPPVPDGLSLLPIPGALLWDDPSTSIAAATAVALTYAHLRGATSLGEVQRVLQRESPLAVIVPTPPHTSLVEQLDALRSLGISFIVGSHDLQQRIGAVSTFRARTRAHAFDLGMRHDPVFSFFPKAIDDMQTIGDNPLSSFVVHAEGERDGVTVTGDLSERVAIEIGVSGEGIGIAETAAIERDAALFPSFLEGVASEQVGNQLRIAWSSHNPITATQLGEAFRVWLKALWNLEIVDVRLAFAPSHGRSALLVDMRARAQQYKAIRDETIDSEVGQM